MKPKPGSWLLLFALFAPSGQAAAPVPDNLWAYAGGSGDDFVNGIAVDPAGNIYLAGETWSNDLPIVGGVQANLGGTTDAFVIKLAPDGQLVYATYLGGSGFDSGRDIAVDAAGNVYVVGFTSSTNFPLQNALDGVRGGNSDAFITKLNPQGNALLFSTYFGGSNEDNAESVGLDGSGNVYVAGRTRSTLTTINAAQASYGGNEDAFVLRLGSALISYDYITYLGGDQVDVANAIAVNSAGTACVAGFTFSSNFPEVNSSQASAGGSQQAFYAAISNAGSTLLLSSILGGNRVDNGRDVDCNTSLLAVVGNTTSTDFPTGTTGTVAIQSTLAGETDGFIAAFDLATGDQQLSTYAGGRRTDQFSGVTITADGTVAAYGDTASVDFPDDDGTPVGLSGTGIFRSTDGGASWQSLNFDYLAVNDLALAASDPARLVAATDLGVYISEDDGATWQQPEDPLAQRVAHTVAVSPSNPCLWIAGVDSDPSDVEASEGVLTESSPIGAISTGDCGETWEPWARPALRFYKASWLPVQNRVVATLDQAPGFTEGTQKDTCVYTAAGTLLDCFGRDGINLFEVNPAEDCEWFEGSSFGDVIRMVGDPTCDPVFSQFNTFAFFPSAVTALAIKADGSKVYAGTKGGKVHSLVPEGAWQERKDTGQEIRALELNDLELEPVYFSTFGQLTQCNDDLTTCTVKTEDTGSTPLSGIHFNGGQMTGYTVRGRDIVFTARPAGFNTRITYLGDDRCESESAHHGIEAQGFSYDPSFYMSLLKYNNCNFPPGNEPPIVDLSELSVGDVDMAAIRTFHLFSKYSIIFADNFESEAPPPSITDGLRTRSVFWFD